MMDGLIQNHSFSPALSSQSTITDTGWDGYTANNNWSLVFVINFPSTLTPQTKFIEGNTSELDVLLKIDSLSQMMFRWTGHKWNAYVNSTILNSSAMAGKTVHFALVYDATNYNALSSSTAVDVGNTTSQANADLKFY